MDEGDTYEEALADVKSAIAFYIETCGAEVLEDDSHVLEAFVAETGVAILKRPGSRSIVMRR